MINVNKIKTKKKIKQNTRILRKIKKNQIKQNISPPNTKIFSPPPYSGLGTGNGLK